MKIKQISYLVVCVLIAVISLLTVASYSKFEIGEIDGRLYLNLITPVFGLIYFSIFFLLIKPKTIISIFIIFIMEIASFSSLHYYVINIYGIGGNYRTEFSKDYYSKTTDELYKLLSSKNHNISWAAWESLNKRNLTDKDILLKYIKLKKRKSPKNYIHEMFVEKAIEEYAKLRDIRVKPYLYEMLKSDFYSEVFENGKNYHYYGSRIHAKKLLKKYFDEETSVVVKVEVSG
jgi:hypothetical protein